MSAKIKMLVKPKKLYRYRALRDAPGNREHEKFKNELKALKDGYLWASNFRAMNDPMEGLYRADETLRSQTELLMMIYHNKFDIGITSFSETVTNELMWAHYADNFRGFCIEYNVQLLLDNLNDDDILVRMTYDEELTEISRDEPSTMALAKKILSRKNHRWVYEREWRLLTTHMPKLHYRNQACVTRIILGTDMFEDYHDALRNLGSTLHIDVQDLVVDGYKLSLAEV